MSFFTRLRPARGLRWLDELDQDVRYGARLLARNPTFTATAVVTLALGIGANTAIFSVVKAVLLEPLPYFQSDRLMQIIQTLPASQSIDGRPRRVAALALGELSALREHARTLARLGAYDAPREVTLSVRDEPFRLVGTPVTAALFPTLGVQPFLGRAFTADDEQPTSPASVILSYSAWQQYFSADPNILNRPITLDGRAYLVSGVMPRGFQFPEAASEFWVPLSLTPDGPGIRSAIAIARLKDGVSPTSAVAETRGIIGAVRATYSADRVSPPAELLEVRRIKAELVQPVRPALMVLMAAVGIVLLIACSNVANLLLARGAARQEERAIRAALGAARARLVRQTLTEGLLLGTLGGVTGLFVAVGAIHLLTLVAADSVPRLNGVSIDPEVLAFTLALSVVTSLVFGSIAALQFSRDNEIKALKASSTMKGTGRYRPERLIVVVETGLALLLLVGGGLLIRSFVNLASVDPGFDPSNLSVFQIALPQPVNPNALIEETTREFEARLERLPGVRSVGFSNALPLIPRDAFGQPRIQGTPLPIQGEPEYREVSPNYFTTIGLRLVAGRGFADANREGQPQVVVVNEAMAKYFGGESPIGKTIMLARDPAEIVGIVNDIHDQALNLDPRPQVYVSSRQTYLSRLGRNVTPLAWGYFVVRSDLSVESLIPQVRTIVKELVPGATLRLNTAGMERVVAKSIARPRLYATLVGLFGGAALLLAMVGVYGITNYSVVQRTREIGIRIALGAAPNEVLALALRQSLVLAAVGMAFGLGAAVVLTRYLRDMLFGLAPLDPVTFVAIPAAFALTVLTAAYLPARRATTVAPLVALRHE